MKNIPFSRSVRLASPRRGQSRPEPFSRFRYQPRLEALENRTLLSIQFTPGPLTVPVTSGADTALGETGLPETIISVNPLDPANIAVSSQSTMRVTTNGGATFSGTTFFPTSWGGDTASVYDSSGRLYWVNLAGSGANQGIGLVELNPSTGGVIAGPFVVNNGGTNDDKEFIAADPNNNNLYVIWTNFAGGTKVFLKRSTDHGHTWSAAVRADNGADGFVWPASVAVGPSGFVYGCYHSLLGFSGLNPDHTGKIVCVRYNNDLTGALRTIPEAQGFSDITYNVQDSTAARRIAGMRFWTQGAGQPQILPDPARPNNVYVISADSVNFSNDKMTIRINRSTNNGASWAAPQGTIIESAPGNAFAMFPQASIDRFGDIVVAWYDNRRGLTNGAGRFKLDVFAKYSTDGGLTWSNDFMVNNASNPFDPDPGAPCRFGPDPDCGTIVNNQRTTRIGEYFAVGIFGGTAYAAWNGNTFSGGVPIGQQVYFKSFGIRGALTVTGTPGNDTITLRSTPGNAAFAEAIVNGQRQYAGLWSALSSVTIAQSGGNDSDNIENAVAGTPVTVNMSTAAGTVNISPVAQNLINIQAPVQVNGATTGTDNLNVFDNNNALITSYTLSNVSIVRGGAAAISYNNLINFLTLNGGSASNTYTVSGTGGINATTLNVRSTVNVETTTAGRPLTINELGSANETVNVSPGAHNLNNIQGALTISGNSGVDTLVINDQSNAAGQTYTLTASTLARTGMATISYVNVQTLTLNGGTGGSNFFITSTMGSFPTILNSNGSGDVVNVQGASTTGTLTINLAGGATTVNITNAANTVDGIANVTVNGNPTSAVVVDDSAFNGDETYGITNATVDVARLGVSLLVYSNLGGLVVTGGTSVTNDLFTIDSTSSPTDVHGGAGPNCFSISPFSNSLATIAGLLTVFGGGGDVISFWDQGNAASETYNFDSVPSMLTLTTVPVEVDFSGMGGGVYLQTNGISTVNDASGTVIVDGSPPCLPGSDGPGIVPVVPDHIRVAAQVNAPASDAPKSETVRADAPASAQVREFTKSPDPLAIDELFSL